MKLSYKWLNEYVSLAGITPEELADKMTTAGLEVEGIEPMAQASGLCIGEVIFCEDIPDTHLHDTIVRVGDKEEDQYKIVCGAPNCRKGLKVIAALPGAQLPGGKITAKPLHGHESNGMLCALYELGVNKKILSEKQLGGIKELPADAPVGETNVLEYLGLDDTILDVSLTPNRADCSAMWNMAKEVGAILNREVKWPEVKGCSNGGEDTDFKVETKSEKCTAYYGKKIGHVAVGPSPKWMKDYLQAAGMNSINNIVDISNFVMLETGQPLHFYDLAKLKSHDIKVVDDQEMTIKALDGQEFAIEKGDLLITSGDETVGIAGIMGGEDSMIGEDTTGIFVEAAHFDPAVIRKTSIRLNLVTEAAQRFTKGLDPLSVQKALDRACELLEKYADASDFGKTICDDHEDYKEITIAETLTHCNGLLGTSFTMDEVAGVLARLDFKPEVEGDTVISHIPSYRTDMACTADIDEEVIRLLGYDGLNSTLPWMEPTVGKLSAGQKTKRGIRDLMSGFNLHEIVTYTLVSKEYVEDTCMPAGEAVSLAMPMSEARRYIRTGLMNSVMECVQYNEAHGNADNNLYEISTVYGQGVVEERLAIVLDGRLHFDELHKQEETSDFYTMKGLLLTWLERLGFAKARVRLKANTKDVEHFHPYRSAEVSLDGKFLGIFGEVHPEYAAKFDLKRCIYAEILLQPVLAAKAGRLRFQPLDRFPGVSRDLALVVDKSVTAAEILAVVTRNSGKIVRDASIFDVYEGEHIEEGKKSVALHIVYQAADHTLKEEEITPVHEKILAQFKAKLNAELRS